MKFKQLIIAIATFTIVGCGGTLSVKQNIDKYDQVAFASIHAFQVVEEAAYHSHQAWPSEAQHQQIGAALSKAYTLVVSIAQAGIALKDGQPLPDAVKTDMAILSKLVADIVGMSAGSPGASTAATAQTKVAALTTAVAGGK